MMADKEDWLLRPVLKGLCKYESLRDGTLSLLDVSIMNEALDVEAENQDKLRRSLERGSK